MSRRLISPLLIGAVLLVGQVSPVAAAVKSPNGDPLPSCGTYVDKPTPARAYSDYKSTLLDTIYMIPKAYAPRDLVKVGKAGIGGSGTVRSVAIDDLKAMTAAAKRAGGPIAVQSAYRSYTTQKSLFNSYVKRSGWSRAVTYSARPGHSEHQLGTVMDFKSNGGKAPWNYADWAKTKAGAWMQQNAWKYGFVLSYPKGKSSDVTCYIYEPWHYRYFGRTEAAKMHDSGLSTREYLWKHGSSGGTDTAPPTVSTPGASIGTTQLTSSTVPLEVSWSASDPSGIASYALQQSVNGGKWSVVSLSDATKDAVTLMRAPGETYRFRVAATDGAGNTSAWATGLTIRLTMVGDDDRHLTYIGSWSSASVKTAYGKRLAYSTTAADSVALDFTGSSVAWVSYTASDRGAAEVWIDGSLAATVDTYAASNSPRMVMFAKSWENPGAHSIEIRIVGTTDRPRVDVDGFVTAD